MIEAPGDVIANPFGGERIVIRRPACNNRRTDSRVQSLPFPGAQDPGGHVYPGQGERFTVLEDGMHFPFGRRYFWAGPGDTAVAPLRIGHCIGNPGQEFFPRRYWSMTTWRPTSETVGTRLCCVNCTLACASPHGPRTTEQS